MEEPVKLYSADEVAEMMNVGRDYIYDRVQDGKLHCYRLGRNRRFSMEQIKEFLERMEINK